MIMVQYLLDTDEEVQIPDIKSQQTNYDDGVAPVKMALEQEKRVSDEIFALFELARDIKDYRAEQFLQWFVKEQVEEVALMNDLLNVVERSKETCCWPRSTSPARASARSQPTRPRPPGRRRVASPASRRVCACR